VAKFKSICCKFGIVPHCLIEKVSMCIYVGATPPYLVGFFGVVGLPLCASLVLSLRMGGVGRRDGLTSTGVDQQRADQRQTLSKVP